ncbi:unnamed protein product [Penicillium glandicola]
MHTVLISKTSQRIQDIRLGLEGRMLENYSAQTLLDEAYQITPVLAVFTEGNSGLVDETASQLTCLKVITGETSDEKDSGESSAVVLRQVGLLALRYKLESLHMILDVLFEMVEVN